MNKIKDLIRYYLFVYFSNRLVDFDVRNDKWLGRYDLTVYIPNISRFVNDGRVPTPNELKISKVQLEFSPKNSRYRFGNVIEGVGKTRDGIEYSDKFITPNNLRYARVDISFYQGRWEEHDTTYGVLKLIRYFLYRKAFLFHVEIVLEKLKVLRNRIFHKVRPLEVIKSKYEIYQAIFSTPDFLKYGVFNKYDLINVLYKNGEMIDIENKKSTISSYRRMKVTGAGVNYYTLVKQEFKKDQVNQNIMKKQTRIQFFTVLFTFVLTVVTALSLVDKKEELSPLYDDAVEYLETNITKRLRGILNAWQSES
ncbi:TPA: hypothetical protein ACN98A_004523 [Vibrio parahaemolyticus]